MTDSLPVTDGLGPLRRTRAREGDFPPVAKAYTRLSEQIREAGLLRRAPWFYALAGLVLVGALVVSVAAFFTLGDSWAQLLVAAGLGIITTQIAFLAHEAAHRQIL